MFILEEPYVSDLLAATVGELGLPVLDTPMARRRLTGRQRGAPVRRRRLRRRSLPRRARGSTPTRRTRSAGSPSTSRHPTSRGGSSCSRTRSRSAISSPTCIPDYRYIGRAGERAARVRPGAPARALHRQAGRGLLQPRRPRGRVRRGVAGGGRRDRGRGPGARPPVPGPGAGPGALRGRGGHRGRGVRRRRLLRRGRRADARQPLRAPLRVGRRRQRPRLPDRRRDRRPPGPARHGVPRGDRPARRPRRLPGPHRAAHRWRAAASRRSRSTRCASAAGARRTWRTSPTA